MRRTGPPSALVCRGGACYGLFTMVRPAATDLTVSPVLVSALGLVVGLTLGWLVSLVLIEVVNPQSFHWGMELHVPWRLLAEFVAIMLALATLTAIASGRQAMSGEAIRAVKEDW